MLTSQSWWWLLWLEQSSKPLAASDNRFGAVLPAWYSWLSGSPNGCGFSTAGDSKGGFSGSFEGTAWWPGLGFAETGEANIYLNLVEIQAWRLARRILAALEKGVGGHLGKRLWQPRQQPRIYITTSQTPNPGFCIWDLKSQMQNTTSQLPGKEAVTARATAPNAERVTKNPAQPGDNEI